MYLWLPWLVLYRFPSVYNVKGYIGTYYHQDKGNVKITKLLPNDKINNLSVVIISTFIYFDVYNSHCKIKKLLYCTNCLIVRDVNTYIGI